MLNFKMSRVRANNLFNIIMEYVRKLTSNVKPSNEFVLALLNVKKI